MAHGDRRALLRPGDLRFAERELDSPVEAGGQRRCDLLADFVYFDGPLLQAQHQPAERQREYEGQRSEQAAEEPQAVQKRARTRRSKRDVRRAGANPAHLDRYLGERQKQPPRVPIEI